VTQGQGKRAGTTPKCTQVRTFIWCMGRAYTRPTHRETSVTQGWEKRVRVSPTSGLSVHGEQTYKLDQIRGERGATTRLTCRETSVTQGQGKRAGTTQSAPKYTYVHEVYGEGLQSTNPP
jgi:hypothetical protein